MYKRLARNFTREQNVDLDRIYDCLSSRSFSLFHARRSDNQELPCA